MFDRATCRAPRSEPSTVVPAGSNPNRTPSVAFKPKPRGDQHPAEMPVSDQDHVAMRHGRRHPVQQFVGPLGHLRRALATRNRMRPHAPVRHRLPDLVGGQALVVAVIPLGEVLGHLVHVQTRQLGSVLRTLARTAQHQRGRQMRPPQMAQHQPGAPRLLLTLDGQRNVRAAGVLAGERPLRLAVTEYVDQRLLVGSHLNIVGTRMYSTGRNDAIRATLRQLTSS